jgi:DNA polymerase-3 subunit epsilon
VSSQSLSSRSQAIQIAKDLLLNQPVNLDTETTGLGPTDEIVEIAIVDHDGEVIFEYLVKPKFPIPQDAIAIHGINNHMVSSAKSFPLIWPLIRSKVIAKSIGIYNASFDLRMMRQSFSNHNVPWKEKLNTFDILELYARFYGEWDSRRGSYRFQSLANAGQQCGISLKNTHRAKDDALLTREILHHMAKADN